MPDEALNSDAVEVRRAGRHSHAAGGDPAVVVSAAGIPPIAVGVAQAAGPAGHVVRGATATSESADDGNRGVRRAIGVAGALLDRYAGARADIHARIRDQACLLRPGTVRLGPAQSDRRIGPSVPGATRTERATAPGCATLAGRATGPGRAARRGRATAPGGTGGSRRAALSAGARSRTSDEQQRRQPDHRQPARPIRVHAAPTIARRGVVGRASLIRCAAGKIRTCYPRLRRPVLYPDELQPQT